MQIYLAANHVKTRTEEALMQADVILGELSAITYILVGDALKDLVRNNTIACPQIDLVVRAENLKHREGWIKFLFEAQDKPFKLTDKIFSFETNDVPVYCHLLTEWPDPLKYEDIMPWGDFMLRIPNPVKTWWEMEDNYLPNKKEAHVKAAL